MNLTLKSKLQIGTVSFLLIELLFLGLLNYLIIQSDKELAEENRSKRIVFECQSLYLDLNNCQNQVKRISWLNKPALHHDFIAGKNSLKKHIARLKHAFKNDSYELKTVEQIEFRTNAILGVLDRTIERMTNTKIKNSETVIEDMDLLIEHERKELDQAMSRVYSTQKSLAESSKERREVRAAYVQILNLVIALTTLGGIALLGTFVNKIVSDLAAIKENTKKIQEGEEPAPPMEGADEIAELDRFMFEMAKSITDSARKQAALVEQAVDVICSLDHELYFLSVNAASEDMFGESVDSLIGQNIVSFVDESESEQVQETLVKAIEGKLQISFETTILPENQDARYVIWNATWSETDQNL